MAPAQNVGTSVPADTSHTGGTRRSRARGLRSSTGCLTCRRRRVKCAEERPSCARCVKAGRSCVYTDDQASFSKSTTTLVEEANAVDEESTGTSSDQVVSLSPQGSRPDRIGNVTAGTPNLFEHQSSGLAVGSPELSGGIIGLAGSIGTAAGQAFADNSSLVSGSPFANFYTDNSSVAFTSATSPGSAPFQWYDLLAQDAVSYFEKNSTLNQDITWDFDPRCLSRRPSASHNLPGDPSTSTTGSGASSGLVQTSYAAPGQRRLNGEHPEIVHPWNLAESIVLQGNEQPYFRHYIEEVAPILDLFDPLKHFGNHVPHMALHNVGLMKALLAVAARHMSLRHLEDTNGSHGSSELTPDHFKDGTRKDHGYVAIQYFYETLKSLAAAMQIPSYTRSSEILATAVLISTYEMFDESSEEWDRHLRGAFWIQRNQDNDGESRGLQEAVWWAWVRQDIWAAFRAGRRTLTIWRPKKPLSLLTADELATRAVYLLAKAVSYASKDATKMQDLSKRLEEGDLLLQALEDWFHALPSIYNPIPCALQSDETFETKWIHPPAYAAAVQSYHFARIIILLNKPSLGGVSTYHKRLSTLREAAHAVCGLAQAATNSSAASAFVNFQCLFAAGQSLQGPEEQAALLEVLEKSMSVCQFAPKTMIDDLRNVWNGTVPVMT